MEHELRILYLDLIEKCLLNLIYEDSWTDWSNRVDPQRFDSERRRLGRDWPSMAHTMIGQIRMRNIRNLVEAVHQNDVPGDLIETGVWRGGACIYMRAILAAYGVHNRRVFVADSFKGMPSPDPLRYPADIADRHHSYTELAVSLDEVKDNFSKYGLLDEQVVFLKGWFKDALPTAPIVRLAVLRLDGNMYESTMDSLTNLYDKVSPGGYVIIDNYGCILNCRQAVDDFRRIHGIVSPIVSIDGWGVYWQKPILLTTIAQTTSVDQLPAQVQSKHSASTLSEKCKITIVHFVINKHAPIFSDLIHLLTDCIRQLQIDCGTSINHLHKDRHNILIGHTCFLPQETLSKITRSGFSYTVFQLEALNDCDGFLKKNPFYIDFLRNAHSVWDYNETNQAFLMKHGCANVSYIPFGHCASLERIVHCDANAKDVDVLFYGVINERRIGVLHALQSKGIKVGALSGVYGSQRDQVIARSKIVLNLHQFDTSQLEQVRIAYLLNNKCFVISESADCNPYGDGVVFSPYNNVVSCCETYLTPEMDVERDRIASMGHAILKSIPMVESIKSALKQLPMGPWSVTP